LRPGIVHPQTKGTYVQIIINTTEELSPVDLEILTALVGKVEAPPAPVPAKAKKPAPEPVVEEPVVEEPVVEEPVVEDLVGGSSYTMKDAVEIATKLVSEGKSADVKKALAKAGVDRVSKLPEDKVDAFVSELS
jgi:hypothetical protein